MDTLSPTNTVVHDDTATATCTEDYLRCIAPVGQQNKDTPRFLVTLDRGIGDAVFVGLSVIDQLIANDPASAGTIDILCSNDLQAEIFAYDPRVNRIIRSGRAFFPGPRTSQWLQGIMLDTGAASIVRFLRQRRYEAIFPSIFAPGLYFRLHSHLMYPSFPELVHDFLALSRLEDAPIGCVARKIVNHYFGQPLSQERLSHEICLYIGAEHVHKARSLIALIKRRACGAEQPCRILLVAPDTASAVTRPPVSLLAPALSCVLEQSPELLVAILPGYTDTACAERLCDLLRQRFTDRVFLLPAEPRPGLLEIAALIDQADVFLSGDTGVMHLAAARKRWKEGNVIHVSGSKTKVISLFGGTNPGYFGHRERTVIVGRGRKEQRHIRPGIAKEAYDPKQRDFFDHISPDHLAQIIRDNLA